MRDLITAKARLKFYRCLYTYLRFLESNSNRDAIDTTNIYAETDLEIESRQQLVISAEREMGHPHFFARHL